MKALFFVSACIWLSGAYVSDSLWGMRRTKGNGYKLWVTTTSGDKDAPSVFDRGIQLNKKRPYLNPSMLLPSVFDRVIQLNEKHPYLNPYMLLRSIKGSRCRYQENQWPSLDWQVQWTSFVEVQSLYFRICPVDSRRGRIIESNLQPSNPLPIEFNENTESALEDTESALKRKISASSPVPRPSTAGEDQASIVRIVRIHVTQNPVAGINPWTTRFKVIQLPTNRDNADPWTLTRIRQSLG
jgi:hypothetical protein